MNMDQGYSAVHQHLPKSEHLLEIKRRSQSIIRKLIFGLCLIFSFFAFSITGFAWDGTGTQTDPYRIKTREDLDILSRNVNDGQSYRNKYFRVINHIEMGGSKNQWTPIGYASFRSFQGHFDGGGWEIRNLYMNQYAEDDFYCGLFGYVSNSENVTLSNIKLVNIEIDVETREKSTAAIYAGGIAGMANSVTLTRCEVSGTIKTLAKGSTYAGGIIGDLISGSISQSSAAADITSSSSNNSEINAGGMVGRFVKTTIEDSYSTGHIDISKPSSTICVGGLFGDGQGVINRVWASGNVTNSGAGSFFHMGGIGGNFHGTATHVSASCDVTGTAENVTLTNVGGLFGTINGKETDKITHAYCDGTVTVTSDKCSVGGLIGETFGKDSFKIEYCYSDAPVTVNGSGGLPKVGGLIGQSSRSIQNCASTQNVQYTSVKEHASACIGGLVGSINNNTHFEVNNCYALGDVSAVTNSNAPVASLYTGGLIGESGPFTSTFENCYATGNVSTIQDINNTKGSIFTGGLIGKSRATIKNCHATGNVNAEGISEVTGGGLVGSHNNLLNHTSIIENSYAEGAVTGSNSKYDSICLGGLIGETGCEIKGSVSSGAVTTILQNYNRDNLTLIAGGIVAKYSGKASITNCRSTSPITMNVHNSWTNIKYPNSKSKNILYIGDIIGYAQNDVTAINCNSECTYNWNATADQGEFTYNTGLVGNRNAIPGIPDLNLNESEPILFLAINGDGSGMYPVGTDVSAFSLDIPDLTFQKWLNVNPDTFVHVKITLTETTALLCRYLPLYTLTLPNGTPSGKYLAGEKITIEANSTEKFKRWVGESSDVDVCLANPDAASTTLTMPPRHTHLTATHNSEDIKLDQTLTISSATSATLNVNGTFVIHAEASSHLPISYTSSTPSVATVTPQGTVTAVGIGTTTITLAQTGDATYNPAVNKYIQITVQDSNINNGGGEKDHKTSAGAVVKVGLPNMESSGRSKPSISGEYTDVVKNRSKKIKLKLIQFDEKNADVELTSNILLYNKKTLTSSYHKKGIFTANFLKEGNQNDLGATVTLSGKIGKKTFDIPETMTILPPKITKVIVDGQAQTDSAIVTLDASLTIEGVHFGKKRPKVWVEYIDGKRKLKKINLKVNPSAPYSDVKGKPSYMEPETGKSQIETTLKIPSKTADLLTPESELYLVIDNASGLTIFRIFLK